jgi:hypothetical protein
MNYRLHPAYSVLLMSVRPGAPYKDRVKDNGKVLIYEGHDAPRAPTTPDPKLVDQPTQTVTGHPTQNKLFLDAALAYKSQACPPERVRVYEKIRPGIWVYNGPFDLLDAWSERAGQRTVFRFRLELVQDAGTQIGGGPKHDVAHNRLIPTAVKLEVWKRDRGRCVECGSTDNLHFDHIIPFSKGGSSLVPENIQLLCARHNIEKRDEII